MLRPVGQTFSVTFDHYLSELSSICLELTEDLGLRPPATDKVLATAETAIGEPLDTGLAAAWRTADGTSNEVPFFARPGFVSQFTFSPVETALKRRASMKKRSSRYGTYTQPTPRDQRVRDGWFHEGWLPFADFHGGTLLLLSDHSPAEHGSVGQVLAFIHDPDEIVFIADTFDEFLDLSLAAIREGYDEVFWQLIPE